MLLRCVVVFLLLSSVFIIQHGIRIEILISEVVFWHFFVLPSLFLQFPSPSPLGLQVALFSFAQAMSSPCSSIAIRPGCTAGLPFAQAVSSPPRLCLPRLTSIGHARSGCAHPYRPLLNSSMFRSRPPRSCMPWSLPAQDASASAFIASYSTLYCIVGCGCWPLGVFLFFCNCCQPFSWLSLVGTLFCLTWPIDETWLFINAKWKKNGNDVGQHCGIHNR